MLKFIAKISIFVSFLSACFLATLNPAIAGRVDNLYDVEILVADESSATREQSFKQGLDEVFIRISGDSIVMEKLKRPPSSRYVKQFSYEPVDKPIVNEKEELLVHRLKIHYNGTAMEKYLLDNGLPAWGVYRSDVVIWLVVRDGKNEYVLKDIDQSLLKTSVVDAMTRRGVPIVWPVFDQTDNKILRVSDIRGGFKEPVEKASKRYSRGPALTGSMIWNGKQWQSSWSLLLQGNSRHWSLNDTDYVQLINNSIDQAADALGEVFAVHTVNNKQQQASVWLYLQAVNSIENYRYVENYLAGLSAVEKVKPAKVDGKNAMFEVLLRSNEADFLNLIKNDAELTELDTLEIQALKNQAPKKQSEGEQAANNQAQETMAKGSQSPVATEKILADDKLNNKSKTATGIKNEPGSETANTSHDTGKGHDDALKDSLQSAADRQIHYYRLNQTR